MRFNRKGGNVEDTLFPFTAMMDAMFILVIFFVTTSVFSDLETELGIRLPGAESSDYQTRQRTKIIINVDANGQFTINQRAFTLPELEGTLMKLAEIGGSSVAIRADANAAHQKVMDVLDACTKADIVDVGFVTLKERPSDPAEGG